MLAPYRLIALCLLLAGFCVSSAVHAQDIYVKPSQPMQHPVDLGLGIKPSAPPQQQVQKPVQPTAQPTAPPVQQPTPPPRVLPQPTPPPQHIPSPPPQNGNVQIVTVADSPISIPSGNGLNVFSITIQSGTMGQLEVNDVTKALGLNPQEISENCTFEHMVVFTIGEGGSAISMGRLPNAQQHFNGAIDAINIFPTIACKKIKHPINGIVIEQGPFYKISAQNVTCPAPPHGGSITMSFKYLGNGKGDCQYK